MANSPPLHNEYEPIAPSQPLQGDMQELNDMFQRILVGPVWTDSLLLSHNAPDEPNDTFTDAPAQPDGVQGLGQDDEDGGGAEFEEGDDFNDGQGSDGEDTSDGMSNEDQGKIIGGDSQRGKVAHTLHNQSRRQLLLGPSTQQRLKRQRHP